jgi:hypothetical protein
MGFPMRCDYMPVERPGTGERFQSLMGFPMRCDFIYRLLLSLNQISFNPLWVFQCAATSFPSFYIVEDVMVSIPYGFSSALRHETRGLFEVPTMGFNPLWVFQCAATRSPIRVPQANVLFQSLMGFPMRCDSASEI